MICMAPSNTADPQKYSLRGLDIEEGFVENPDPSFASIFYRAVGDPKKQHLIYLEGGPGAESPRPIVSESLLELTENFRLIFVDARGTGRNNPLSLDQLAELETAAQANYLSKFRATNTKLTQ